MKTLKNVQKQATLIASVKMLNIRFINKHIINLGIVVGFLVSINYQSLVSKFFPLAPFQLFFSEKYRRNRL